jgi:PHD/YefM family antitoxin component YafN of YafNO toxin-antitoxin module
MEGNDMSAIRPSSDLRNSYNEISEICHKNNEPVYITKDGVTDLAVMSVEAFENLQGRLELYTLIEEGLEDMKADRGKPLENVFSELRNKHGYDEFL